MVEKTDQEKQGRGRPKKMEDEKVVVRVNFCLSTKEATALNKICEHEKISKTQFIRDSIIKKYFEIEHIEDYYADMYYDFDEETDNEEGFRD